jgi:hypothetical protein
MENNEQQQQTATHWKKLTDPRFIGSHDFQPNQEITVTIESVTKQELELFNGRKLENKQCVLATFKGAKKPMLLNKENMKLISKCIGSPYIEEWVGKSITLHVVPVSAFGEIVDAVRVKYIKNK